MECWFEIGAGRRSPQFGSASIFSRLPKTTEQLQRLFKIYSCKCMHINIETAYIYQYTISKIDSLEKGAVFIYIDFH